MVAGGLGERLGYTGIKIGLQNELITLRTYIEVYTDFIKAFEDRIKKRREMPSDWYIPFCIMTSGDTHDKTVSLLKSKSNFGMRPNQITILKQNKLKINYFFSLILKDVFYLLYKNIKHGFRRSTQIS